MASASTLAGLGSLTGLLDEVTGVSGSFLDAFSQKSQGEYEVGQYLFNAAISDMLAQESIEIGNKRAAKIKQIAGQIIGKQRASFAGQNVDVSTGSAIELQEDTRRQSTLDALETQNNAWKQAWGYQIKALDQRTQAEFKKIQSESSFQQTLISGGAQLVSSAASVAGGFF